MPGAGTGSRCRTGLVVVEVVRQTVRQAGGRKAEPVSAALSAATTPSSTLRLAEIRAVLAGPPDAHPSAEIATPGA